MSPSVQDRSKRSQRKGFSGRGSCPPWVFKGHPLNLDMGNSGDDRGNHLKFYCNRGDSGADCGHINWYLYGTGIACSWVGVGSVVGMTGGERGIACCRSFVMDSIALIVVYP